MADQDAETYEYSDADKDAIHILPLAIIPLATPGLRKTKLIKNAQLNTVVELFRDDRAGSGQIAIENLRDQFVGQGPGFEDDLAIVEALGEAESFDVYSLRLTLRSHNLMVEDGRHLQLSPAMQDQLTSYMRVFTRPLVRRVFGDDSSHVATAGAIVEMFRSADRHETLKKLKKVSDALDMSVEQIPAFLEDYGDTFLSLSYFRRYLDQVRPDFESFKRWAKDGILNSHVGKQPEAVEACERVEREFNAATRFVLRRFGHFDEISRIFWVDLNPARYATLRHTITGHHLSIGGTLCGLAVKMNRWRHEFPSASGSPNNRLDFLMSEMIPGLDKIRNLENRAPDISS